MSTEKHGEDATPGEEVRGWFAGRLPDGWFTAPPEVLVDREEITVVGPLGDLDTAPDASPAAQAAAADGRARRFREGADYNAHGRHGEEGSCTALFGFD